MLDVYGNPTVEALAGEFGEEWVRRAGQGTPATDFGWQSETLSETLSETDEFDKASEKVSDKVSNERKLSRRHFLCGTAQLVSLLFVCSFFALQWLAPYLTYTVMVEEEYDFIEAVLGG